MTNTAPTLDAALLRIAEALERLSPQASPAPDFAAADAFIWQAEENRFVPVPRVNRMPIALLKSVDRMRDTLLANTRRFAADCPPTTRCCGARAAWAKARWSRRCMREVNRGARAPRRLVLIEDPSRGHRQPAAAAPRCCAAGKRRFLLYCDDLSFDKDDTSYKSLKAALEGGIEGRPANVLFYATSNRRHLMPRDMVDNERATAINPGEAVEEKVSLSDRFGLWLGFHNCSQDDYLGDGRGLCATITGSKIAPEELRARGARLGDGPRLALRPRGLAVHPGFGRPRATAGVIPTARSQPGAGY